MNEQEPLHYTEEDVKEFQRNVLNIARDNEPVLLDGFIVGKNPILEKLPSKFIMNEENMKVVADLVQLASEYDLMGLSANQVGIDAQLFVLKDWETYRAYINPRVVYESPELALGTESDVSFPGLSVKITRPYSIRVRYTDINGEIKTETLEGGTARLFQHEMTHMHGTYFWDDANFLNRNKAIKDWKNIQRKLKKYE